MPRTKLTAEATNASNNNPAAPDVSTTSTGAGDAAAKVAVDYQAITDRINPLIARAEKALAALRLSVSGSVELEPPENGWNTLLAFRKIDKEWRLLVEVGDPELERKDWDITPLQAAPRALRLLALKVLPDLERALVQRAREQMSGAAEALAQAEDFVAALEARAK